MRQWINTYIKTKYFSYIRKKCLIRATLARKCCSGLLMLLSASMLLFWGVSLILTPEQIVDPNPSKFLEFIWPIKPWLQLATVLLPHVNFISELRYDHKSLKRRLEWFEARR